MTDCPQWTDDVPAEKSREFLSAVRAAYHQVAPTASSVVLDINAPQKWHGILFRDFVPLDYYAGNYRQHDSSRICLGINIRVAGVPGSPFRRVRQDLATLLGQLRVTLAQTELHWPALGGTERAKRLALILATLIGCFIRIHPFINGNGRVSRLIWAWGLLRFGVPIQCRIHPRPLSPYSDVMREAMLGNDGPLAFHILQRLGTHPPKVNPS